MNDLLALVKQSLAIVSTATTRDTELIALINAGLEDLKRQGIDTEIENKDLINATIIMFVKANFGMIDEKQKEYAQKSYISLCHNLSLSGEYKEALDD